MIFLSVLIPQHQQHHLSMPQLTHSENQILSAPDQELLIQIIHPTQATVASIPIDLLRGPQLLVQQTTQVTQPLVIVMQGYIAEAMLPEIRITNQQALGTDLPGLPCLPLHHRLLASEQVFKRLKANTFNHSLLI